MKKFFGLEANFMLFVAKAIGRCGQGQVGGPGQQLFFCGLTTGHAWHLEKSVFSHNVFLS